MFVHHHNINLDISNKCTLKCNACERSMPHFKDLRKVTGDMPLEDFKKIADYYPTISLCGQIGDPIFNRDLDKMLAYCVGRSHITVQTAAPHKSNDWYHKVFTANKDAVWVFGIDGLVDTSSIYREGQDTHRLFNVMLQARDMGLHVRWQYIVFSHNEHQMQAAVDVANSLSLPLDFLHSNRFDEHSEMKPSEGLYIPKSEEESDELVPKCLDPKTGRPPGYSAMGYILPCCWLAEGNVEEKYPDLCNEKTKLSNLNSVQELIKNDAVREFWDTLQDNPANAPRRCWEKCGNKATKPKLFS